MKFIGRIFVTNYLLYWQIGYRQKHFWNHWNEYYWTKFTAEHAIFMVIILDSNLEIVAHIMSILCNLIYLRHFVRSIFVFRKDLHAFATCTELPSNISTIVCPRSLCHILVFLDTQYTLVSTKLLYLISLKVNQVGLMLFWYSVYMINVCKVIVICIVI